MSIDYRQETSLALPGGGVEIYDVYSKDKVAEDKTSFSASLIIKL